MILSRAPAGRRSKISQNKKFNTDPDTISSDKELQFYMPNRHMSQPRRLFGPSRKKMKDLKNIEKKLEPMKNNCDFKDTKQEDPLISVFYHKQN